MNLFVLDEDPILAAKYHCDAHVRKMLLEYTQQLTCAYHASIGVRTSRDMNEMSVSSLFRSRFAGFPRQLPYRPTHYGHPCTVWTRESAANFDWVLQLATALAGEFRSRWAKQHAVEPLLEWMQDHPVGLTGRSTPFVQCMPESRKMDDPVIAYRRLYVSKASNFSMRWTNRELPHWLTEDLIGDVHPGFGPGCVAGVSRGKARVFMYHFSGDPGRHPTLPWT